MNVAEIDATIERYVAERQTTSRSKASKRMLVLLAARYDGDRLGDFLAKISSCSYSYYRLHMFFKKPSSNGEFAVGIVSIVAIILTLTMFHFTRHPGFLVGCAAFCVAFWSCLGSLAKKWCDNGIVAHFYYELHEVAADLVRELSTTIKPC